MLTWLNDRLYMLVDTRKRNVFHYHHHHMRTTSNRDGNKSCSARTSMYISFQNGRVKRYTSSRDVTVIYNDYVRLLAVVLFAFMCRFKVSPRPTLAHRATSGWRKKKKKKKNSSEQKIIISRHVHLRFLFSVHCFFLRVYLFCYIFGQIHLTNGYVRAYQWTLLLSSSFYFSLPSCRFVIGNS